MKKQGMRVPYALAVYGKEEVAAVANVLKNPLKITPGDKVKAFEKEIGKLFDKPYATMVNSGSSANLLALASLKLPEGSEVITPALTFATTLAPIVQLGLIPVFVDVVPGSYLIDIDKLERAINKKTRALMIPSLLGNIPDLVRLRAIARKHKLFLIEDSCDTLGGRFAGKPTGSYTDISTTSFYGSHIITAAGGGGMVATRDPKLARAILVQSSWGRDSTLFGVHEKSEDIKKRFAGRIGKQAYDAKFVFSEIGYNFQSTELQAAFGLEQLKRLKKFTQRRQSNFARLLKFFKHYESLFVLPVQDKRATTAWLSFPLTIRPGAPFTRMDITKFLEEHNVQTRPIFTGNVLRQPAFAYLSKKSSPDQFAVADNIMQNGFVIGCHQGMEAAHIARLEEVVKEFLTTYGIK